MTALNIKSPSDADTSEGQTENVENPENQLYSKRASRDNRNYAVRYRCHDGSVIGFTGKRGRSFELLARSPSGLTQWDTLPWHTRLGASIHDMRRAGLLIETRMEPNADSGRHARYFLRTPGRLLQPVGEAA